MPAHHTRIWAKRAATVGAFLILMLAVILVGWRLTATDAAERTQILGEESTDLERRNKDLARTNELLRRRVTALRTDSRMVEKVAREEHHLVLPGSRVYLFTGKQ